MVHFKTRQQLKNNLSIYFCMGTSANFFVLGLMPYFLVFGINLVLGEQAQEIKSLKSIFKKSIEPYFERFFSIHSQKDM